MIGRGFNETGLLLLPDGALLAAMRSAGDKASVSITRSTDGGRAWSEPLALSEPMAHPADLTLLPDGRVLLVDTGYPSSVVLPDGRVLTFYYAVGSRTHPDWGVHCGVVEFPSTWNR